MSIWRRILCRKPICVHTRDWNSLVLGLASQIVRNEARASMRRRSRAVRELSHRRRNSGNVRNSRTIRSGLAEADRGMADAGRIQRRFASYRGGSISPGDLRIKSDSGTECGEPRELASGYGLTPANVYKIKMRTRERLARRIGSTPQKRNESRRRRDETAAGIASDRFRLFRGILGLGGTGLAYMIRMRRS